MTHIVVTKNNFDFIGIRCNFYEKEGFLVGEALFFYISSVILLEEEVSVVLHISIEVEFLESGA